MVKNGTLLLRYSCMSVYLSVTWLYIFHEACRGDIFNRYCFSSAAQKNKNKDRVTAVFVTAINFLEDKLVCLVVSLKLTNLT